MRNAHKQLENNSRKHCQIFTASLLPKAFLSFDEKHIFSDQDIQYNMYINHCRDPLFLQECNYIVSNKTWKGPTSFKMQCVLPRQQGGIPSSWNMLTSLCGWTVGNRRGKSVETDKKTKYLTHKYQRHWDICNCFLVKSLHSVQLIMS